MSERITTEWTKTTDQAFGITNEIIKGQLAEQMYAEWAPNVYDHVIYYPYDREKQIAGIDFEIMKNTWSRMYSLDVKGNLTDKGNFWVENKPTGWLRDKKKTNDRVVHICTTTGYAVEYDRKQMIQYIDSINEQNEYINMSVFDKGIQHLIRRFKVKK